MCRVFLYRPCVFSRKQPHFFLILALFRWKHRSLLSISPVVPAACMRSVKLSSMEAHPDAPNPTHRMHYDSEEYLKAAGPAWTMIRTSFYFQNFLNTAPRIRREGVLSLPVIALFVYGAIAFVPVFSMIYVAKILENSTNYSLMNTTQQTLYLPTSAAEKFDGKTTVDTFFWRFGDILQAGVVFAGLHWFGFGTRGFALLNTVLCVLWIALGVLIGRRYSALARAETNNTAPTRLRQPEDLLFYPGRPIDHRLPTETFFDPDPGDVLAYEARLAGGAPLPHWLEFDRAMARLSGTAPVDCVIEERIEIIACDMDGATATAVFTMRRATS